MSRCSDEVGALCAQSVARMKNKGTALATNGPAPDALEDLLNAMAAVYDVFPDLWLDQELRYGTKKYYMNPWKWPTVLCTFHPVMHATSLPSQLHHLYSPSEFSFVHAYVAGRCWVRAVVLCAQI